MSKFINCKGLGFRVFSWQSSSIVRVSGLGFSHGKAHLQEFGIWGFLIAKFLARAKKRELYSREQNYEDHTYDTQKFIELPFAETIMDLCGCMI
jgi:hypothetical protein